MSVEFCDTNVLVYPFDSKGGMKDEAARHLLNRLRVSQEGGLSLQVLQEFYANVMRKLSPLIEAARERAIL